MKSILGIYYPNRRFPWKVPFSSLQTFTFIQWLKASLPASEARRNAWAA